MLRMILSKIKASGVMGRGLNRDSLISVTFQCWLTESRNKTLNCGAQSLGLNRKDEKLSSKNLDRHSYILHISPKS